MNELREKNAELRALEIPPENSQKSSESEFPRLNGPLSLGRRYAKGRDAVIFTADIRQKVFELACQGKDFADIGVIIGCTRSLVRQRCRQEVDKGHLIAKANDIKLSNQLDRSLKLTDMERFQIQTMAGLGLQNTQIALIMNISLSLLQTVHQEDLYLGRANAHLKVAGVLYDMATDHEHPNETKFFLKAQHGWKESTQIEFPDANGQPQSIASNVQLNDAKIQVLIEQLNERV